MFTFAPRLLVSTKGQHRDSKKRARRFDRRRRRANKLEKGKMYLFVGGAILLYSPKYNVHGKPTTTSPVIGHLPVDVPVMFLSSRPFTDHNKTKGFLVHLGYQDIFGYVFFASNEYDEEDGGFQAHRHFHRVLA
jgi:hypothetical protein